MPGQDGVDRAAVIVGQTQVRPRRNLHLLDHGEGPAGAADRQRRRTLGPNDTAQLVDGAIDLVGALLQGVAARLVVDGAAQAAAAKSTGKKAAESTRR